MLALERILDPMGTIWWNVGDSYMTRMIMRSSSADRIRHYGGERTKWAGNPHRRVSSGHAYLKDKDLALIPEQIAIGAQRAGYWVRSIVIWSKEPHDSSTSGKQGRTHVPESVLDRPVTGHEYLLMLTKSKKYSYFKPKSNGRPGGAAPLNVRSVWRFPPVNGAGDHVARFPDELPRRCIELSTKKGDVVFDPFSGAGTSLRVAAALGRKFIGSDVSKTYVDLARRSVAQSGTNSEKRNMSAARRNSSP